MQLTHLGAGEKDAILLAEEIGADLLIIDGLVNLTQVVSRLLATNFRIRRDFVETLLKRHEPR